MRSRNRFVASLLVGLALGSLVPGCSPGGSSGGSEAGLSALPRGLFPFPTRTPIGPGQAVGIARGDLDGDSVPDLAVTIGYNSPPDALGVHLLYMERGQVADTQLLQGLRNPIGVSIEDLDGDARNDLAVLDAIGEVAVFLQVSPGVFAAPVPYSVGDGPSTLVSVDFTGDGEFDYLTANSNG